MTSQTPPGTLEKFILYRHMTSHDHFTTWDPGKVHSHLMDSHHQPNITRDLGKNNLKETLYYTRKCFILIFCLFGDRSCFQIAGLIDFCRGRSNCLKSGKIGHGKSRKSTLNVFVASLPLCGRAIGNGQLL